MKKPALQSVMAIGLLLAASTASAGKRLPELFAEANKAYFAEDYELARSRYETLVRSGVRDPDVYYNLGLAHAQLENFGHAVLSFDRGLVLRPSDAEAQRKLEQVEATILERTGDLSGFEKDSSLVRFVAAAVPESWVAWPLVLSSLVLFGSLGWIRLRSGGSAFRTAALVAAVVGLGCVATVGAKWLHRAGEGRAVILDERVAVREGPDPRAPVAAHLHQGQRVLVRDQFEGYFQVSHPDAMGWVRIPRVGRIRPIRQH